MENMVNIYLFGKQYSVPEDLTIMRAMEYAGYQLVRGCGCRNGFCGACATIYRIKGDRELKTCLACQTKVENNMYIATLPFFPLVKQVYDIEKIKPTEQIMMQLYPEIYACVGCNACTKSCTQGLNVMQYIAYAQRGEFDKCAEESFDCVMCGVCSSRCPAGISHPQVAMLARRLNGKYLAPKSEHLENRVREIRDGKVFMHPLETRDVAAASIIRECSDHKEGVDTGSGEAVWLDTPMIEKIGGEGTIERRIPAMMRMFASYGIDIRKEPILVYPTLHYQNGGLDINVDGMTPNVENLYVAGEAVGGIHGRNRLMGNSLLDIIVFGRSAGQHAAEKAKSVRVGKLTLDHIAKFDKEREAAGIVTDAVSPKLLPDYRRKFN